MEARPPLVMWVQGMENLGMPDLLYDNKASSCSGCTDISQFLLDQNPMMHLQQTPQYQKKTSRDISNIRIITNGVVDFIMDGHNLRLISEKLGNSDVIDFIIKAPRATNIIITQRPKYLSKKKIEKELTESNRVTVDLRMPRPLNIFGLLDKNNWSKECVMVHLVKSAKFVFKELLRASLQSYFYNYSK